MARPPRHQPNPEGGVGPETAEQGSAGGGWRYSRVPPGDLQSGALDTGASQGASTTLGGPPQPQGKLSWLVPAAVLFGAVFLQNAGLYSATWTYVRWMDEFSEAEQKLGGAPSVIEDVVLVDPLADMLVSWRLPTVPDVGWTPEGWAEVLSTGLALIWLAWVARAKDLQSWSKVMLSGAALAAMKGLVAWATVLPEPSDWRGCRTRLGEAGMAYFREVAAGGTDGGGPAMGSLQASQDIGLLTISGICMMGRLGRQRVCADTVFSTPTCYSLLLTMGIFDLARSSTQDFESVRRSTVRTVIGLTLGLVLVVHLALTLLSPQHYTLDVAIAYPLTLLVYTSPVMSITSKRWVEEWSVQIRSALSSSPPWPSSPSGALLPEAPDVPAGDRDVGEANVPPCCLPFCCFGGLYYLRGQPGNPAIRPWTDECERRYQQQLAEFRELREGFESRKRRLKEDIERESKLAQDREAELRAACERRVEEERGKVAEREREVLAEASERLEGERKAAAEAKAKASAARQSLEEGQSLWEELRVQVSGEAEAFRKRAAEILKEAERLRELTRKAEEAKAASEEEQVEALMAIPEPVKEAAVNGDAKDPVESGGDDQDEDPSTGGGEGQGEEPSEHVG